MHPEIPPGILSQITPGIPAGIAPRILVMISSEISLGIFFKFIQRLVKKLQYSVHNVFQGFTPGLFQDYL